jgi:hypothetical protein
MTGADAHSLKQALIKSQDVTAANVRDGKILVSADGLEPSIHALKGLPTLKMQYLEDLTGGHSELL